MLKVYNLYDLAIIYGIERSKLHYWEEGNTSVADEYYLYKADNAFYTGYAGTMGSSPDSNYSVMSPTANSSIASVYSTLSSSTGTDYIGYGSTDLTTELSLKANVSQIPHSITPEIKVTLNSGAMTITVTGGGILSFSNPTTGYLYSATLDTDLTLTVPSGATLGSTSALLSNILVVALYNNGSPVIGVVNKRNGLDLSGVSLLSTTAISSSATSMSTVYSASSLTGQMYTVLGYVNSTQTTAGYWATTPSNIIIYRTLNQQSYRRSVRSLPITLAGSTSYAFTGIPSWVRKITVFLQQVVTSGSSIPLLRVGTNSTPLTTGYSSSGGGSAATVSAQTAATTGFIIGNSNSTSLSHTGAIVLHSLDGLSWFVGENLVYFSTTYVGTTAGYITLSGLLDTVQLSTVNGTDTINSGNFSLLLEE